MLKFRKLSCRRRKGRSVVNSNGAVNLDDLKTSGPVQECETSPIQAEYSKLTVVVSVHVLGWVPWQQRLFWQKCK